MIFKLAEYNMIEKPDATTSLGLELEGNVLKGIQLSFVKGKPKLEKLFEIPIDYDHVNPLYKADPQVLQKSLQKSLIVTTLSVQEVLIRPLEIKLKKEKDIREVLLFQSEPLLPYPADNAILDYIKIGPSEEGTFLTVLAARKDHLQQHLEFWSKIQIEPEMVTAVPAALANFASTYAPSDQSYCMINLGLNQTTCLFMQENKLIAAQSVPYGVSHLKEAVNMEGQNSLGSIDIDQISMENNPPLYQAWETMRLEIKRAVFSLSKQAKAQPLKELLIAGTGALIPHLASSLAQDLEMKQIFPRQELLSSLTMGQILNFAVPIGAAINGLPIAKDAVNFRQEEFAYPHPWKRLKNPLILYTCLSLALAFALYLFGQSYLSYRQDQLRQSYIGLLTVLNKPYETFEKEYEAKHPFYKGPENEIAAPQDLNDKALLERVQYLEKELQSTPELFALLPNVPKVSDVLAWLNSLPVFSSKKNRTDAQGIQIESFDYTLVKRPEQSKKKERYQVKIEIELTSSTPKQAREFHDALIAPNDFVDPKGEVKWNSSHGRYRTSFFLKDKTIYP